MKYKMKPGIVLFSMFESYYLYPCRYSEVKPPMIVPVSSQLVSLLQGQTTNINTSDKKKLQHLIKTGFVKEYSS